MEKKKFEYIIPVQGQEDCDEYNAILERMHGENFTRLLSTETHIENLLDKLMDTIEEVGADGGWYVSDGIRVKIEVEYEPENK